MHNLSIIFLKPLLYRFYMNDSLAASSIKDMMRMEPLHLGHSNGPVW